MLELVRKGLLVLGGGSNSVEYFIHFRKNGQKKALKVSDHEYLRIADILLKNGATRFAVRVPTDEGFITWFLSPSEVDTLEERKEETN